jgi:hypothetical protein
MAKKFYSPGKDEFGIINILVWLILLLVMQSCKAKLKTPTTALLFVI